MVFKNTNQIVRFPDALKMNANPFLQPTVPSIRGLQTEALGTEQGESQPNVCFCKDNIIRAQSLHSSLYCLGCFLCKDRIEQFQQKSYSLQTQNYLLCGPFLERVANSYPASAGSRLWLTMGLCPFLLCHPPAWSPSWTWASVLPFWFHGADLDIKPHTPS